MIQGLNSAKIPTTDYTLLTMLRHLAIRNYAIAESLDIEFSSGLTAITGETGAGKSIILGAMSLILGDRADRDVVRTGADRAEISAEFDISQLPAAQQWLANNELTASSDDTCLIRRSVSADGRSRAWINGSQVTLQNLGELGGMLMDIHSQHEHHSLLKKATHQHLLDDYAGLSEQAGRLRKLAEQWRHVQKSLSEAQRIFDEQRALQELAQYQLNELDELALGAGELQSLDEELDQLSHAEARQENLQRLLLLCRNDEENNVLRMLDQSLHLLRQAGKNDQLSVIQELLTSASIQVEEAAGEITRQLDRIEINPARLAEVNQRLSDIHQLARKHRTTPEELPALAIHLQNQLLAQTKNQDSIRQLQRESQELLTQWGTLAENLSIARRTAATRLTDEVNAQLAALSMRDARLSIDMQACDPSIPQPNGLETVELLISTNAGTPPKSLARIASGGELSRISLAIQVITARTTSTPTLVFDEVDVGIGGAVARTVGALLRQLGQRSQVLCVTHQASVAGQANQHLQVSKTAEDGRVQSSVILLNGAERLEEVARMLGGAINEQGEMSDTALEHARELLVVD